MGREENYIVINTTRTRGPKTTTDAKWREKKDNDSLVDPRGNEGLECNDNDRGPQQSALMPKGFNRKKRDKSVSWAAVFLSMIRFPDAAGNTLGRVGRWEGAARSCKAGMISDLF